MREIFLVIVVSALSMTAANVIKSTGACYAAILKADASKVYTASELDLLRSRVESDRTESTVIVTDQADK